MAMRRKPKRKGKLEEAPRFGVRPLSTKQAAELLDCSRGTVLSLIHRGILKGQKKRWSNQYEVQPLSMLFYVGEYTPDQPLPEWNKETGTLRAPLDMTLEKWEECRSKYGDTDYEWKEEKRKLGAPRGPMGETVSRQNCRPTESRATGRSCARTGNFVERQSSGGDS